MIVEKLGNDAADAVNALSNATCTLEGSAKQVAWAEDIRTKCIAQALDQLRDLVGSYKYEFYQNDRLNLISYGGYPLALQLDVLAQLEQYVKPIPTLLLLCFYVVSAHPDIPPQYLLECG